MELRLPAEIGFFRRLGGLVSLTKPTIVLTYVLTGASAMVVERSLLGEPLVFFAVLLGILLTGAGANGLNQYLEREIDAQMERTRNRRPLPLGLISPRTALVWSLALCASALIVLIFSANVLSLLISLATILFYSFFYTLWLKPRTPYNIVIGGAAGATAPLIGWAAATGSLSLTAFWMFLLIFMWTPPHFWALALAVKEQYRNVALPMLPVVKGERRTLREILSYSLLMVPLTYWPLATMEPGIFYLSAATGLNAVWLFLAFQLFRKNSVRSAYAFFGYSILYIIGLFSAMMGGLEIS